MSNNEVLNAAISHYGDLQKTVAMEEMAELIKELSKDIQWRYLTMTIEEMILTFVAIIFVITFTGYLIYSLAKYEIKRFDLEKQHSKSMARLMHEYGKVLEERNALRQELADAEAYVRRCRTNGEWVSTCERDQLLATIRNQQRIIKNLNRQVERNKENELCVKN